MKKVFVTSDPHHGHNAIIGFENRPFNDVQEMDKEIIKRWNSVVKGGDIVFHLGDFSFYNKEDTKKIVDKLNGYKILIMGNHDRSKSRNWWLDVGFDEVSKYPIIYRDFYILSHEPVYLNRNMPYANLHGHTHGHSLYGIGVNYINCCVELHDYTPVIFDELISKLNHEKHEEGSE